MSSGQQDFLYRKFFRLKIHESVGDAFQQLFSNLMVYSEPGFQAVSPWGNWGDGGNDGWVESERHYYQVYGPKPSDRIKEAEAVKKSIEDFDKLIKKWGDVRKYSFVMNDRFQGIPAPVSASLLQLKQDKTLHHSGAIGSHHLMKLFMELPEDQRQDLVGYIPPETPSFIDSRAVGQLLTYLSESSGATLTFLSETAPNFIEKIAFNGLSKRVGSRLESNSYQVYVINEFLDSVDEGYRQTIANEVKGIYEDSKLEFPESEEGFADLRYFWMVDKLIPPLIKKHPQQMSMFRMSSELVLAKYFETCDVYEHPVNASST